jgi:hypothetical protein
LELLFNLLLFFAFHCYVYAAMKNTKLCLAAVWLLFLFNDALLAQSEWCGTMRNLQRQITLNPALEVSYQQMLNTFESMGAEEHSREGNATNEIITIPVVFHIVHNGDALGTQENISDAQVLSQIDALNQHYNFQDPGISTVPVPFQNLVANCGIKFCLAKFDPDGNPTTGIIRHQFSNATWDSENDIDNTLKPATIWDKNRYLNIWSVKMGGQISSDGVLAYATFPFFGAANQDGIVARYNVIGTTGSLMAQYNMGKSVTHEVGHWLGLLHIWGTGPGCGDQGDFIADTPDQDDLNFGCPNFPKVSCTASAPNGDMFMNYMDYTLDACRTMFTNGQNDRMHSILNGARASIKSSAVSACYYNLDANLVSITFPKDTICSTTFRPIVTVRNEGVVTINSGKFYFQLDGDVVQIFNWSGSIPSQGELDITLPEQFTVGGMHTFDVTFGNVNGQPADNFSGNDSRSSTFFVYDGGSGSSVPFTEDFENSFPAANWSLLNPNNDATWEKNQSFGGYGQSSSCVSIDNFSFATNPGKRKDAFVTEAFDFSNLSYPQLKFDVAYAAYSAARADSLNVYYSLNCGKTWTKIWNQKGTELATAPNQTFLFTPSASQWKTVSVPLLNIAGQNKVSFKFENVCGWGNVLYLDNINIENNIALGLNEASKLDVRVFPNPASDLVGIRLPSNHPFKTYKVYNNLGELVWEAAFTESSAIFSTLAFPAGVYFIHLEGTASTQTEKLIISK